MVQLAKLASTLSGSSGTSAQYSAVESRVEELQKRKSDIEQQIGVNSGGGDVGPVKDRQTVLLSPEGLKTVTVTDAALGSSGLDVDSAVPGDAKLLMQSLKLKKGSSDPEGPPLTTKAMRELARLEKERLYEYALVRIRCVHSP